MHIRLSKSRSLIHMSTSVFERENMFSYLWVSVVFYRHVPKLYINMLVMGLVHGPCLMVISVTGILLYAKVSPLYNVLQEWFIVVCT